MISQGRKVMKIDQLQTQRTARALLAGVLALAVMLGLSSMLSRFQAMAQSPVEILADLEVVKEVDKTQAAPGETLVYTITVENNLGSDVDAWMTDTLPPELTFLYGGAVLGSSGEAGGVITWSYTLPPLGKDYITFAAAISSEIDSAQIVNTAQLTGAGDLFTADSPQTVVQRPFGEITADKSVYPTTARPGQYLTYTVRIANIGNDAVATAYMTDALPPEVSLVAGSLSANMGTVGEAGGVITWSSSLGPSGTLMPPYAEAIITFTVEIASDLGENETLTNTAEITGAGELVSASASTALATQTHIFLPIIMSGYPPKVFLNPIPAPDQNHSYTISWIGAQIPIDHYVLQQSRDSGFSSIEKSWTTQSTLQLVQPVYCAYYYRARADKADAWGEGPWSNVRAGVASPPVPILNDILPPDILNTYIVQWSASPVPVDRYVLQESKDAGFASVTKEWQLTGTSLLVEKSVTSDTFYYRVRADDDDCWGKGTWSSVKSVTSGFYYSDDFSDYRSGWPREWTRTRGALYQVRPYEHPDCPGSYCQYDDGDGYVISRRSSSQPYARFGPSIAIPSNRYKIEFKARWWDSSYYATYELLFGANKAFNESYVLKVRQMDHLDPRSSCEYTLFRRGGGAYIIQDWSYIPEIHCQDRSFNSSAPWNKWRIERDGNDIEIWVNNKKLGKWQDDDYKANRYFGVGATLYEGFTPGKPEFDNFEITLLP